MPAVNPNTNPRTAVTPTAISRIPKKKPQTAIPIRPIKPIASAIPDAINISVLEIFVIDGVFFGFSKFGH